MFGRDVLGAAQVQQFGSVPHLLYITASADLLAISKGMKEYNSQLRNISATCWSSVLQRFSGSSRATPVGIVSSMQTAATSWVDAGGTGLQAVLDCSSDEYGVRTLIFGVRLIMSRSLSKQLQKFVLY